MKNINKVSLIIFTTLFVVFVINLCMVNNMSGTLKSIDQKLKTGSSNSPTGLQTQYLLAPPREGGTNPYYEGFFRDYGDGEIHPHRQALMLLLSHLAALGERQATQTHDSEESKKD